MASVILSSFGQVAAGPVGAALGSLAAGGADQLLRQRSRGLPDLRIPTSAYGDLFPRIYGTTRVSGVVIWASPLARGGGGKGGAGGTDGYVASLAVAFSSRPVVGVGRIWADGREIRNRDGQFATPVTFRVHRGLPGQKPDPLLVAFEGADSTPAYQGLAYAVLEDFPVSSYGNRIPALSFEVIADPQALPADWLSDLLSPLKLVAGDGQGEPVATGFCASAEQLRANAESLARFLALDLARDGVGWSVPATPAVWTIPPQDLVAEPEVEAAGRGARRETDYEGRPGRLEIAYLDPARDFQRGLQAMDAGASGRSQALGLEVAATAAQARRLAERHLARERHASERLFLKLPWKWANVAPGQLLRLGERPEVWRVEEQVFLPEGCEIGCVRAFAGVEQQGLAAEPGRAAAMFASPVPRTDLMLFEPVAPLWNAMDRELIIVAAGPSGWKGAELALRVPGAVDPVSLGRTEAGLAFGTTAAGIGDGFPGVWDWRSELRLRVSGGEDRLQGRPAVAVLQGANLLLVGDELMQFLEVLPDSDGVVVLRGLLRGCQGTEAVAHEEGERWAEIVPAGCWGVRVSPDWVGGTVSVEALGPGDRGAPAVGEWRIEGRGGFALRPCHVRAVWLGPDQLHVGWISRRRDEFAWGLDNETSDGPHLVEISGPGGAEPCFRSALTAGGELVIPLSDLKAQLDAGFQALEIVVEAEGPGPARYRRSAPVRLPF